MSFVSYPQYKSTNIEWLGSVPFHWELRKVIRDMPYVVGWTPPSGNADYYDGDLPWVTIADMTSGEIIDTASKITEKAVKDKGASLIPAGSMLFSFKLSVGKVAFTEIDVYSNEAIAAFLENKKIDLRFWSYAAPDVLIKNGRENIYGATLLNQELIGSSVFYAPALEEQTQIARFLDHEVGKIDALIAEQEKLIALLKERRSALISAAVTGKIDVRGWQPPAAQ